MKIAPALKGVITAALMIGATLLINYTKADPNSILGYSHYILYAGGIAWALIAYTRSPQFSGKFGDTFQRGFRCFIIVTLIMVVFTAILHLSHPEWARQEAAAYKAHAIKEGSKGNVSLPEIERNAQSIEKGFVTTHLSLAVFGYLMTGAIFTAIGAALLTARKQ